jgi:hypothetical protein
MSFQQLLWNSLVDASPSRDHLVTFRPQKPDPPGEMGSVSDFDGQE